MTTDCNRNILIVAIIAAIVVCYASFSWLCPLMLDDYNFIMQYRDANGGSHAPTFHGIWTYASGIWHDENGRLANMLCAPVALWMPKGVWAVGLATMICAIYLMMAKMVNGDWQFSPLLLMAVWIACILALPWWDYSSLMPVDFALNYFPSALLTLVVINAALRFETGSVMGRWHYAAILLAAIFLGLFHEGGSLPMVGAFTLIAASRRFDMPRQWWGVYVALLVGTTFCIGSPAIWQRYLDTNPGHTAFLLKHYIRSLVKTTPLLAFTCAAVCVALMSGGCRGQLRVFVRNRLNVYLVVVAMLSALMTIATGAAARAAVWSHMLLIVLWLRVVRSIYAGSRWHHIHMPVAVVALVAACTFFYGVNYWQKKLNDEYNEIMFFLATAGPKAVLYKDTIRSTPWWTHKHPIVGLWYTNVQAYCVNAFMGRDKNTAPVLPTVLRDYDFSNPTPIGDSDRYFQAGDFILFKSDGTPYDKVACNLRFILNDGREIGSYVEVIPFVVEQELWLMGTPVRTQVQGPYRKVSDAAH